MTLVSLCVCSLSQSVFATYDFFSQSAEVGCEVQRIMGAIIKQLLNEVEQDMRNY